MSKTNKSQIQAVSMLPLVKFHYKGTKDRKAYSRLVRLMTMSKDYIEGFDTQDSYQYKKFTRKNVNDKNIAVVEFNKL